MAAGGNRIAIGWTLAAVCWIFALVMISMPSYNETGNGYDSDNDGISDNCDQYPYDSRYGDGGLCEEDNFASDIGGGACCCLSGFLCLGIVDSGKKAKQTALTQVIYVPQQPVQQVVHHHTTHTYVPQQAVPQQAPPTAPIMTSTQAELLGDLVEPERPPGKSQAEWAMAARNFEVALNWKKAAESYEKAEMFAEAGRVRQQQLEKTGSGVNIHVKSGDTYHDSVVMKDENSNDPTQP